MPDPADDRPGGAADGALGVIREPLENRFLREEYIPAPITLLNGYLLWGGSRIYRLRFGIGVNEWRILGTLSNWPGTTAAKASEALGMNKAIVSRSIASLVEKKLIVSEAAGRARRLYLTEAGAAKFTQIRPIASERERVLLEGLSGDEVDTLRHLLMRLVAQGDNLRAYDDAMIADVGGAIDLDSDLDLDEDEDEAGH